MKHFKSAISVILAVILLISVFTAVPSTANATDTPSFIVDQVVVGAGQKNIALDVSLKNNPGVSSIALDVHYDKTALTLTNFAYNTEALDGASTVPFSSTAKIPCLSMVNGTSNITGDFVFATLYFDVANNASGSYDITLTYDEDNVYDINEKNILFNTVNGKITVNGTETSTPEFVVSNATVKSGTKSVPITVSLKNNPGVASIALDINYDDSALTLTGFVYNISEFSGASTVPYNSSAKPPCLSVINGMANMTGDFVVATLYFDVADNASGNYTITLAYDEDNVYDISEQNVSFDVVSGKITIGENDSTDPSTEPSTSTPATDPTAPSTDPSTSTPVTDPTDPSTEPSTSTPVTDPTDSSTEPSTSTPVTDPTDPSTEPTIPTSVTSPTESTKKNIEFCDVSGIKSKTYNGKAQTQSVVVKDGANTLVFGKDFTVSYKNNKSAGTATVTITGIGTFEGSIKKTFSIAKAKNTITSKANKKTVKLKDIKRKNLIIKKSITVKNARGPVSYKAVKKGTSKGLSISKKGVITIKKGSAKKKTTLRIVVKITAKGNKNYKSKTIKKTVKIKIK